MEVDKQMMQKQRKKTAKEILIRQKLQNELPDDRAHIGIDKKLILEERGRKEEEKTKVAKHLATQLNELETAQARTKAERQSFGVISKG